MASAGASAGAGAGAGAGARKGVLKGGSGGADALPAAGHRDGADALAPATGAVQHIVFGLCRRCMGQAAAYNVSKAGLGGGVPGPGLGGVPVLVPLPPAVSGAAAGVASKPSTPAQPADTARKLFATPPP